VKHRLSNISTINFLGYLFLGCGIADTVADFVSRIEFSFPLNMGIVLGNTGMIAAGLLGTMAAKSLKELDQRLQRIEDTQHHPHA